ncbi:hypothetical protein SD71_10210 [Cohnella kolymensis]|uniref:Uncharacterized protein n=1 Tax=Cohnella kolymensis TaxID=1590652 RepID=A0ABR5A456_9BACL|nr:hypothetical protein SD71_10210 [Cohnella kolymensis]
MDQDSQFTYYLFLTDVLFLVCKAKNMDPIEKNMINKIKNGTLFAETNVLLKNEREPRKENILANKRSLDFSNFNHLQCFHYVHQNGPIYGQFI